ncbi:ATP-dependent helicase [Paenibacillus sp. JJ-223]|uniref:UvrD-helicase domain-containing protein n=1 Tax=Paenibacillus sp. JJ-223 TaxID=2905647 RepID=UPI001F1D4FA0|nr:ATP-dependent helicase [Paenibacillus sp. JJ-223]CAH1201902.1 Putative ATP-dependent DNA helicase YjcD [Paenibacillus sp. JJ-223]
MDKVRVISSDERISELTNHFKVIAGPGAGKTHWLVMHILNVLQNVRNLTSTSKIACITYTTVAGEEIQKRLGTNQNKVEVSTIHSFLYANIVKPYIYLMKDDNGNTLVNIEELDGHDDNIATKGKIYVWQQEAKNGSYLTDKIKIKKCLENLDWKLEDGEIKLKPRKFYLSKIGRYSIRSEEMLLYKKQFWKEGVIHHEDVLYFAYKILEEYPVLLEHLSSKYPYIFIDEFQDTNPIQTEIIKKLSNAGSVIGVIGDSAQSIYEFQGASRQEFISFTLPNQTTYSIENNRRCGSKIVDFLNCIRSGDELEQKPTRDDSEIDVYFYECSETTDISVTSFHELRSRFGLDGDYCILTRNNDTVKRLRNAEVEDIWSIFNEVDANRERFIKKIFTAYKSIKDNRQEAGVKELIKVFRTDKDGFLKEPFQESQHISSIKKRSLAVDLLEFMAGRMDEFYNGSLYDFYESLFQTLKTKNYGIKKITRGKIKEFSDATSIKKLLDNLILPEEKSSDIRTIHKAKGMEFQSVLLYLSDIDEVNQIINPDIDSNEDDTRILYVALSRAKDFLYIACPPLNKEAKKKLTTMNIKQFVPDSNGMVRA